MGISLIVDGQLVLLGDPLGSDLGLCLSLVPSVRQELFQVRIRVSQQLLDDVAQICPWFDLVTLTS